ncbi:MAG: hypothetical protein PHS41_12395 [Victivallaceae bacterium]|nr:hypothetical protein [Victivallaceae bacterium]
MLYLLENLMVDARRAGRGTAEDLLGFVAEAAGIAPEEIRELNLLSEGIDARSPGAPKLIYSCSFESEAGAKGKACAIDQLPEKYAPSAWQVPDAVGSLRNPVVVGTGPAGIFAGLILALAGTNPLILDRGPQVETRWRKADEFRRGAGDLDEEANLLIGEGGAGTFSDGKLYTRIRDANIRNILAEFIAAGAPEEIRYKKHPHIGSDRLRIVTGNLRKRIEALGGTFRFGAEVTDVVEDRNRCRAVVLANGEIIEAPQIILAFGLGGRKLSMQLAQRNVAWEMKGFQLGCRIEHEQNFIDRMQYHLPSRPAALGAAEYNLVSRPAGKSSVPPVSSFCMCPGGEIVMASAWRGQLVSNGMSNFARSGRFANSCLIVTLPPGRFSSPSAAYEYLRQEEQKMFELGSGNYAFPAQSAEGFLAGRAELVRKEGSSVRGIVPARLDLALPPELSSGLGYALRDFGKRCRGFLEGGQLTGFESCVSSPVRFLRDKERLASSLKGLYLAGEGAGYSGGIISAAADGVRIAYQILKNNPD